MLYSHQRRRNLTQGIFALWTNWVISVGFLTLPILIAPLVSHHILPLIPLFLIGIITILDRRNRNQQSPNCFRVPHMIQYVLFISSILLIVDILYKSNTEINELINQPVNMSHPLLPALNIYPVTMIICLINLIRGNNSRSCHSCRNRHGKIIDRGLIGVLYNREAKQQIKLLYYFSLVLSLSTWIYYIFFYVNVNINQTDSFIFAICPLMFYVISIIFLGIKYYSLWGFYCQGGDSKMFTEHRGTSIRYIVVSGEKIFIKSQCTINTDGLPDELKSDVPLTVSLPFRENIMENEAQDYFKESTHLQDVRLRLIYQSGDPGMFKNIFHYIVFVDEANEVANSLNGTWVTLPEINEMIQRGDVSMSLGAELSHIYTVTMAWKTYDKSGRRRYEIKNYKPTFNLKDMSNWDVDYNDHNWLYVAEVNEDKPFYTLRRIWHKITKGIGE